MNSSNHPAAQNLTLNQQVMLNQFISITGCTYEQSLVLLESSDWQYQVCACSLFTSSINSNIDLLINLIIKTALSIFFDDYSMLKSNSQQQPMSLTPNKSSHNSVSSGYTYNNTVIQNLD